MFRKIGADLITMALGFALVFAIGEWASDLYYHTDLSREICAAIGVGVFITVVATRRAIHEGFKKEVKKYVANIIKSVKNELKEG